MGRKKEKKEAENISGLTTRRELCRWCQVRNTDGIVFVWQDKIRVIGNGLKRNEFRTGR